MNSIPPSTGDLFFKSIKPPKSLSFLGANHIPIIKKKKIELIFAGIQKTFDKIKNAARTATHTESSAKIVNNSVRTR